MDGFNNLLLGNLSQVPMGTPPINPASEIRMPHEMGQWQGQDWNRDLRQPMAPAEEIRLNQPDLNITPYNAPLPEEGFNPMSMLGALGGGGGEAPRMPMAPSGGVSRFTPVKNVMDMLPMQQPATTLNLLANPYG